MSLDERLRELLQYYYPHDYSEGSPDDVEAVQKIKQAFAEEGYRQTNHFEMVNMAADANGVLYPARKCQPNHMTGQDWYDRLSNEVESLTHYHRSLFREDYPGVTEADYREMFVKEDLIEAAKRAAGLDK